MHSDPRIIAVDRDPARLDLALVWRKTRNRGKAAGRFAPFYEPWAAFSLERGAKNQLTRLDPHAL